MVFVPTLQFQQNQKILLQKKTVGEIDEVEYHRFLDELITKEVQDQQNMVLDLAIQEMRESAARSLEAQEQAKQDAEKEAEHKKNALASAQAHQKRQEEANQRHQELVQQSQQEEEAERQREARLIYRLKIVPGEITFLKSRYESAKNRYTGLQIISIIFSIATTTLVGSDIFPRGIVLLCSGLAAVAATLLSTFRMREHNYSYYQAISYMEGEIHDYDQRVGDYTGLDEEQAYRRFAARISEIKQQYISQELAMWKAMPSGDPKGTAQPLVSGPIENQQDIEESESNQASPATKIEESESEG